jgi:aspartyl-tRNA(Asn)/glutamyl-tRNA(Gln) amidotransferase subunit A
MHGRGRCTDLDSRLVDTAVQLAASVRAGSTTAQAVLNKALARIDSLDARLSAWVEVDREAAASPIAQSSAGPLAGVPVGVKDIIDVAGLPSRLGASAFAHRHPGRDSSAVARLRAAGASVLGKTHTTQFAFLDPAPTWNPWREDRTPGGSSSGSAVAVAAGMVPIALGSQTVGSVLRPAAYCGIVGLKPTFGRIAYDGTAHLAPSFDHIGVLCRTVADAALALSVLAGSDHPTDPRAADVPVDDYLSGSNAPRPPRIGFARAFTESAAESEVTRHMFAVAQQLSAAGAIVSDVELPLSAPEVLELGQPILRSEAAVVHAQWYATHAAEYGPRIGGLIEAGVRVSAVDVERARAALRGLADALEGVLRGVDVLLIPAAPTTAPARETTGNGIFCAAASFTGLPAIALPSALGADGLPLSVQLVGARFAERTLLTAAAWCERCLAFGATPSIARG